MQSVRRQHPRGLAADSRRMSTKLSTEIRDDLAARFPGSTYRPHRRGTTTGSCAAGGPPIGAGSRQNGAKHQPPPQARTTGTGASGGRTGRPRGCGWGAAKSALRGQLPRRSTLSRLFCTGLPGFPSSRHGRGRLEWPAAAVCVSPEDRHTRLHAVPHPSTRPSSPAHPFAQRRRGAAQLRQ